MLRCWPTIKAENDVWEPMQERRFTPPSSCCSYEAACPPSCTSCQGSWNNDAFACYFFPSRCLPCTDPSSWLSWDAVRKCDCVPFVASLRWGNFVLFWSPTECGLKQPTWFVDNTCLWIWTVNAPKSQKTSLCGSGNPLYCWLLFTVFSTFSFFWCSQSLHCVVSFGNLSVQTCRQLLVRWYFRYDSAC